MAGELQPSLGDIRPHGHLKLGRFTQHFVDVLDLEKTPLEFFEATYPNDPREDQRKYLGRFGVSGPMQIQKMAELSDGQKSRVVFAKLGRDVPHIVSCIQTFLFDAHFQLFLSNIHTVIISTICLNQLLLDERKSSIVPL